MDRWEQIQAPTAVPMTPEELMEEAYIGWDGDCDCSWCWDGECGGDCSVDHRVYCDRHARQLDELYAEAA